MSKSSKLHNEDKLVKKGTRDWWEDGEATRF